MYTGEPENFAKLLQAIDEIGYELDWVVVGGNAHRRRPSSRTAAKPSTTSSCSRRSCRRSWPTRTRPPSSTSTCSSKYLPDGKSEALLGYQLLLVVAPLRHGGEGVRLRGHPDVRLRGGRRPSPTGPAAGSTPRPTRARARPRVAHGDRGQPGRLRGARGLRAHRRAVPVQPTDSVVALEGDYGTGTTLEDVGKTIDELGAWSGAVEKFLIFTIVGLSRGRHVRDLRQRARAHLHHHGHLQLRPRRHRHARRVRLLAAPRRLGLADAGRRWSVVLLVLAPLFGLLLERVVMRGLEGTTEATKLVVSISLLVAMIGLANLVWEPGRSRADGARSSRATPSTWASPPSPTTRPSPSSSPSLVALGLRFLLYRTRIGVSMRANVDDRSLVLLNGARPEPRRDAQLGGRLGAGRGRRHPHRVERSSLESGVAVAAHRQRLRRRHLRPAAVAAARPSSARW